MRTLAALAVILVVAPLASAADAPGPLAAATAAVKAALARERAALVELGKQPPSWDAARTAAYQSQLRLDSAFASVANAPAANELEDDVATIKDHDHAALSAINNKNLAAARTALLAAVNAKQNLISRLGGLTESKRCDVEKPFDVFAVPAGYAGAYADVFPHGVPKNAKNIKVEFVDLATGKAPAPELFPGQTWTSKIVGFLPDGRLQVHVDVSGTGIGKRDENSKHWEVVVTYDC
jgi:hypothetical protein